MAKTKAQPVRPQARPRRSHAADAERMGRLLIVGGVAAVLLVVAGLIAFGWYQTQIKPLGKTVLQVGDFKFSLGHLERRMELRRDESPFFQQAQGIPVLADEVLDQLEVEGKMLSSAGTLEVTVTDEELAAEIRDRGGLADDVEADLYAQEFRAQVQDSGLKENEYLQMIRVELLQTKLIQYYSFLAPAEEPQVKARYFVTDDEEVAQGAIERVRAGETFEAVTTELGGEQASGELDWTVRGGSALLPGTVEDYLFDEAVPGQISDAMLADTFFYVVLLEEKDDARALDDTQRSRVAQRELGDWLNGLDVSVKRDFTLEDENRALDDIF